MNDPHPGIKWRNLTLLALAELLAMTLWFSASALVPQLSQLWQLESSQVAWLTMSVQLGFVMGAFLSAVLNLADRFDSRHLFAVCAVLGAGFNAAIAVFEIGPGAVIFLRFLTGMSLAGVYPPGMKIMATWSQKDRGLGIGLLVGALTLGSATPHLLNALPVFGRGGMPPWQPVLWATSGMALLAAILVAFGVRSGPYLSQGAPFDARYVIRAFSQPATRLANFGYLGHMWELYAMWAWVPIFLLDRLPESGWSLEQARLVGFAVIAVGAVGCVAAGVLADRMGRTTIAIASLLVSGSCAILVGFVADSPLVLTILCLIWGLAVVADSAQFSAAISELSDPRYVGTALTVQTSAGFLLTLVTLQMIPALIDTWGWDRVFTLLAVGPAFGVWSMWRLRRLPEAVRMASGHR